SNHVNGITWYSPNFTRPGEFAFCEECYNQFIRNTPLNVYIRKDGIFTGNCDFSPNVKQQWLIAVSKNDINIFWKYVESKLGRARELHAHLAQLQALHTQETQMKGLLINYMISCRGRGNVLDLVSDTEPNYFFNGRHLRGHNSDEVARKQIQIDESNKKIEHYFREMIQLQHELANLWYIN
ncbi:27870_t:CDS:1, partial [Gigaspora margarita]